MFLGASLMYRIGVVHEVVVTIFSSWNGILRVLPVDDECVVRRESGKLLPHFPDGFARGNQNLSSSR
jgi:hypothetical protein